jgi:hypothetical protein
MTHAHFIVMGGFAVEMSYGQRQRVSVEAFVELVANEGVKLTPDLEAEILDKSKASSIAKLAACIQISWFIAQLIGRRRQKLDTSILEMFTLGVVICSLISYGFWLKKPLDVRTPIVLKIEHLMDSLPRQQSAAAANPKYTPDRRWNLVPLYFRPFRRKLSLFTLLILPVFATCHLVVWNWSFPSRTEQDLWRICSIGCLVFPMLFSLAAWVPFDWCTRNTTIIPLIVVYVLLRICMIAEIFASLRSMPEGVYTSVHLPYWPHF